MSKPSWGLKRHCVRCGNRFYDLGKNPVPCPKCKHINDINAPFRPRRGRGKAAAKPVLVKPDLAPKPKKAVKQIEGVDIEEFEDIETLDTDSDIEEIEEVDDMESIEEIEEIEDDNKSVVEEDIPEEDEVAGPVLVDGIDDGIEGEDDEDEEDDGKKTKDDKKVAKDPKKKSVVKPASSSFASRKPATSKAVKAKPKSSAPKKLVRLAQKSKPKAKSAPAKKKKKK